MGSVNTSTTHPLRGTTGSLASTTCPFLLVGFCTATGNFTAHFRLMSAETCICHLTNISLVHQIYINGGFKDRGGKFHFTQLLALYIQNIYFHSYLAPISPAITACEPL